MGLNISKSGVSPSVRTGMGSISAKGFSLRTGIRGLSYRKSFGKSSDGAGLVVLLLVVFVALIPFLIQVAIVAVQILWMLAIWAGRALIAAYNVMLWTWQTGGDYINYRRSLRHAAPPPDAALLEGEDARLPDVRER
jgi:hypothetical protein